MAIIGIGVDVTEVERVAKLLEQYGERFIKKVFTSIESNYCQDRAHAAARFAARFAAKEAASKALGTGFQQGVSWRSIWVENLPSGQPTVRLDRGAERLALELGVEHIHLSLTHTKGLAVAVVIIEGGG